MRVVKYALAEDCGPLVNPLLVDGQIHGAVAQGVGEALLEGLVYDADAQLLSGTLMDYAVPRADDLPSFEIEHMETPSRLSHRGEGHGRGRTIGAPVAIGQRGSPSGRAARRFPARRCRFVRRR